MDGWPTWFRGSFTAAAQLASHLNWLENTQTQIVSRRMEEPSLQHYQCEQCAMLYAFQHSIIIYIPLKLTQHVQNLIGEHTDTDYEQTDGGTLSPTLSMSAHSSRDVLLKILLQSTLNSSCSKLSKTWSWQWCWCNLKLAALINWNPISKCTRWSGMIIIKSNKQYGLDCGGRD